MAVQWRRTSRRGVFWREEMSSDSRSRRSAKEVRTFALCARRYGPTSRAFFPKNASTNTKQLTHAYRDNSLSTLLTRPTSPITARYVGDTASVSHAKFELSSCVVGRHGVRIWTIELNSRIPLCRFLPELLVGGSSFSSSF